MPLSAKESSVSKRTLRVAKRWYVYIDLMRNGAEQFVAVCCSVLQCVAVCCSVLQCVAVSCGVLQCVAVYC